MSKADELVKLYTLRKSGALSQEEFDDVKAKLLTGLHPVAAPDLPQPSDAEMPLDEQSVQVLDTRGYAPESHNDDEPPLPPTFRAVEAGTPLPPTAQTQTEVDSDSSPATKSKTRPTKVLIIAGAAIVVLAVVFLLFSRGESPNSPASAATKLNTSFTRGHPEAFCSTFVPAQRPGCVSWYEEMARTTKNFKIGRLRTDGDRALVVTTGSFCSMSDSRKSCDSNADPDLGFGSGRSFHKLWADATSGSGRPSVETEFIIPTQKENGKWYVTYPPFAGIPGSGGMSVVQLASDAKSQITGRKPSGFHVTGVSSVICNPPSIWARGRTFICDAYASSGVWVGGYFGTVLPNDSKGDQQWNVAWSKATNKIVAMCKTAVSVGADLTTAEQTNTLLPGASNEARKLNIEAQAVGSPWLILVGDLSTAGKTNRWANVKTAIVALDDACDGPLSLSIPPATTVQASTTRTPPPVTSTTSPSRRVLTFTDGLVGLERALSKAFSAGQIPSAATIANVTATCGPSPTKLTAGEVIACGVATPAGDDAEMFLQITGSRGNEFVPLMVGSEIPCTALNPAELSAIRINRPMDCPPTPTTTTTVPATTTTAAPTTTTTSTTTTMAPTTTTTALVDVPGEIAGMSSTRATQVLEARGFRVVAADTTAAQCPFNPGDVASWSPYEPALPEGSTVTIEVCPGDPQDGGPGYTALPEVGAMQEATAVHLLEVSGFRVVAKPGGYAGLCDGGTFGSPGQVQVESPGTPYALTGSTVTIGFCR